MTAEEKTFKQKYITIRQVAAYLQVTKQTISNWIGKGRLKVQHLPSGRIQILLSDFLDFLIENNLYVDKKFFGFKAIKIVVIDDDENIIQLLRTFFFSFCPDCEVEYITDPIEGLIKIGEIRPDIVLLDIMMENMNGIEVCRKILDNKNLPDTKVIILSGFVEKYKKELDALNIYARLSKPIRYSVLKSIIQPLIEKTRVTNI